MVTGARLIFKGSSVRLIQMIISIVVGFILLPFLINNLGSEQYGLWVVSLTVISFYGFLDAGMTIACQRFVAREIHAEKGGQINEAVSTSFYLFLLVSFFAIVLTILIVVIGPYFIEKESHRDLFQVTILLLGLGPIIGIPFSVFYGVIHAKYRFDILSYTGILSQIMRAGLILYFIGNGHTIITLAIITILITIMEKVVAFYYAKKLLPELKISWVYFQKKRLVEYFHYGKYVFITNISDKVRSSIDNLVVGNAIGLSAVTNYSVAIFIITYFGKVMDSIFGVIGPVFNKYHKQNKWDELRKIFLVTTGITSYISILIGGVVIIFGEVFIKLWLGEGYDDSYYILIILSVASIISNAQRPCVAILYAISKHKFYSKITSVEAAVNLTLSLILVNYIGIYGVALGTLLPSLITKIIYQPRYTCRQVGITYSLYYKMLLKNFITGAVVFIPVHLFINSILVDSYLELFLLVCGATYIYSFIILHFILKNEELGFIKKIMPGKIYNMTSYVFLFRR